MGNNNVAHNLQHQNVTQFPNAKRIKVTDIGLTNNNSLNSPKSNHFRQNNVVGQQAIPLPPSGNNFGCFNENSNLNQNPPTPQRTLKRKRSQPTSFEDASPKHKNAKIALFSILGEAGLLAQNTDKDEQIPMMSLNGELANPHQIVSVKNSAHAIVNGSNNPQHLERLASILQQPQMIKDLYSEFCNRLARPVDITKAWKYFVSELAHYIYAQCKKNGKNSVTFDQVESFIKTNWFSITQANSLALTNKEYDENFPAVKDCPSAIVLKNVGDSPMRREEDHFVRRGESFFQDMDVDMDE